MKLFQFRFPGIDFSTLFFVGIDFKKRTKKERMPSVTEINFGRTNQQVNRK